MRTIGNIERFLVIGIVVVIGAILAVAIKGADDLDGAYKKQVQAKSNEGKRGGGPLLSKVDSTRGNGGAPANSKKDPVDKGALGTDPAHLSAQVQELLNQPRRDGAHPESATPPDGTLARPGDGKGTPAAPSPSVDPNGGGTKQDGDPQAPVVIKDDRKELPDNGGGVAPVGDRARGGDKKVEAAPVEPTPAALAWTYEVQPGDRLERIAASLYGERSMWKDILAVNPAFTDPTRIRAGAVLTLPKTPVNTTVTGLAHGTTKSTTTAPQDDKRDAKVVDNAHGTPTPANNNSKSTSFKRVTNTDQYEVQKGDTLMAIAATHYGTRAAWRMILGANTERIADKDHIKPGTLLKLPAE